MRSGNHRLGTLLDNCSTDNYVTHAMAKRLKLSGEDVELEVEGVGGVKNNVDSKIYKVPVYDIYGVEHTIECYGMDVITTPADPPELESYAKVCAKFRVRPEQMKRPKYIDLLVSMREHYLLSDHKETSVGGMALYKGPLGLVFGGLDRELKFVSHKMAFNSTKVVVRTVPSCVLRATVKEVKRSFATRTDREILEFFKEESIGAQANPACGGCICGNCILGGKQMSLKDEKSYNFFFQGMRHDVEGTPEDPGPYWRIKLPWIINKNELVENKAAVIGVMNATLKKLERDKQWRAIYEQQLKDLLKKGFAREVPDSEIEEKRKAGFKIYYIAHQMALNPSSKTTPVRCVYNCSQVYKGHSLNESLALGPEYGLASLHGVLLRFREGPHAAQGDITKQYYMLRLEPEEEMMQLWLWKFAEDDQVKTFCMTRLVMGLKPSTNLAVIAMKETAKLGNFQAEKPDAHRALAKESYADNTFVTGDSHEDVKKKVEEVEFVAAHGGFKYKEWTFSGEKVPHHVISVHLPNAIGVEEEKALGVSWDVTNDELFVKVDVTSGSKKKSGSSKIIISEVTNKCILDMKQVVPKLRLRDCLSIHSKPFDPLGFVLPVRMVGNLLFRKSLQVMNTRESRETNKIKGPIPWDLEVPSEFLGEWLEYFTDLTELEKVRFSRSVVPKDADPEILPFCVTLSDSNPDSSGANIYGIWTKLDGSRIATLLMAKAKLAPLQYKGETSRQELAGAAKAARLKCWVLEHTGLKFSDFVHLLDSRIVQDMIRKDSYGFGTYAGLRVAEIQQKTDVDKWFHIESAENVADILTRGAKPKDIMPGSVWQCGPPWLVWDRNRWPITEVVLTNQEKEVVARYAHKKPSLKTLNSESSQKTSNPSTFLPGSYKSAGDAGHIDLDGLISRCGSNLGKLIRSTAFVLRYVGKLTLCSTAYGLRMVGSAPPNAGVGARPALACQALAYNSSSISKSISAKEYGEAWSFLICYEQSRRLDRSKMQSIQCIEREIEFTFPVPSLSPYALGASGRKLKQIILSPRVKNFPVGFSNKEVFVPVLPNGPLARILAQYYHDKYHTDIDSVVTHIRNEVWILNIRKIVSAVDKRCKICLIKRKKMASQLMGDLPEFRFKPSAAFSAVCMDLFGPLVIKDDCVKRGPKVAKKVWGVLYTCTASRAVQLDVAVDYSTEAVLHTIRRLLAVRGGTRIVISDPGTQLVGASNEMKQWRKGWDKETLIRFGAENSMEWNFIMASSQHQNGAAESLIKFTKGVMKSFIRVYGDSKLTLNELNTLLWETANVVNERPIGTRPNSQTDTEYLSPNSLLLGRNSSRICSGPFSSKELFESKHSSLRTRFRMVQSICDQFWSNWHKLYFPTLLWRQKWHHQKRNLQIGDVCVVQDANALRGEWRLAKVVDVFPDKHGVVRNVAIAVAPKFDGSKKFKPKALFKLRRHVSNLIVIVPVDENSEVLDQHSLAEENSQG